MSGRQCLFFWDGIQIRAGNGVYESDREVAIKDGRGWLYVRFRFDGVPLDQRCFESYEQAADAVIAHYDRQAENAKRNADEWRADKEAKATQPAA